MNPLFVAVFATLAVYTAASPSGIGGTVVAGPSGIVTGHGAIGPVAVGHGAGLGWGGLGVGGLGVGGLGVGGLGLGAGLGWGGWAGHGAVLAAPVAVAAPAVVGLGVGHGLGLGNGLGLGLGLGHGVGAITNGGGTISATGHGAAIRGPPTAPVVVAGPSGKVAADGLWGPTANIGLTHGHGW